MHIFKFIITYSNIIINKKELIIFLDIVCEGYLTVNSIYSNPYITYMDGKNTQLNKMMFSEYKTMFFSILLELSLY